MSKIENAESFITTYRKFYFKNKEGEEISDEEFQEDGIPTDLNRTDVGLEEHIIKKLNDGIYDAEAFAWKAGRAKWENNGFEYKEGMEEKWVNGNGNPIKKDKNSQNYTKKKFEKYVKNVNNNNMLEYKRGKDIKTFYKEVAKAYNLYNFGTVNIINVMFFLSEGAIPIYDYFAHVAVKALLMDKNPKEIFVPGAPGKKEHPRGKEGFNKEEYYLALNLLEEYMWLLEKVFREEIRKEENNGMYISRELDQALWVYGHAYKKWPIKA